MGAPDGIGVTLAHAAREIGVAESTVRRWVRQGAPTVALGRVGRGCGSRVNIVDLRRWRHGAAADRAADEFLDVLATALHDFHRRDTGLDAPAHRTIGIPAKMAAAYLTLAFGYCALQIVGHETELPLGIQRLFEIARG